MRSRFFALLVVAWLLKNPLLEIEAETKLMTCNSQQVTSLKDSMTSSWFVSQYSGVDGSITCASLCLREDRCVSFLYNDVVKDCRLLATVQALEDVTSTVAGYRYYDTCRAAGHYGARCAKNGDCRLTNTVCSTLRCRCSTLYAFDLTLAKCVLVKTQATDGDEESSEVD